MRVAHLQSEFVQEDVPQLVTDLQNIADRLVRMSKASITGAPVDWASPDRGSKTLSYLQATKMLIEDRKKRDFRFSALLFADPVWDTMLALLLGQLEGKRVSITSASLAAKVPMTTALRCLAKMEQDGLIVRKPTPFDRRSSSVTLTVAAYKDMLIYIENVAERWGIELNSLVHHAMI
jgi:hypothetical protein